MQRVDHVWTAEHVDHQCEDVLVSSLHQALAERFGGAAWVKESLHSNQVLVSSLHQALAERFGGQHTY